MATATDRANMPQDADSTLAARIDWLVKNYESQGMTVEMATQIATAEPAGTAVDATPTAATPAATGGSQLASGTPEGTAKAEATKAASLLTFNAKPGLKKYTQQFKKMPGTPDPSFISGGKTKAERAAYARSLANMTIKPGMAAADVAAIRKARIWYTGQTAGRTGKGKAGDAKYGANSVKAKRLALTGEAKKEPGKKKLTPVEKHLARIKARNEGRKGTGKVKGGRVAGPFVPGRVAGVTDKRDSGTKTKTSTTPRSKATTRQGLERGSQVASDRAVKMLVGGRVGVHASAGKEGSLELARARVRQNKRDESAQAEARKEKATRSAASRQGKSPKTTKKTLTMAEKRALARRQKAAQSPTALGLDTFLDPTPLPKPPRLLPSIAQQAQERSAAVVSELVNVGGYKPPKKPKQRKKSSFGGGR